MDRGAQRVNSELRDVKGVMLYCHRRSDEVNVDCQILKYPTSCGLVK